ncbi:hypothetical protein CBR_g8572 [Chara braunii]|nr:hypothetical protein CBR_g8572 [Chara braunii]|eukprot:GBG60549.1 hypothetical protein CBR_g8572 [Chara braunii]
METRELAGTRTSEGGSAMDVEASRMLGKRKAIVQHRRKESQGQVEDKYEQRTEERDSEEDESEQGDSDFRDIPGGVEAAMRGERQFEERYLLPFVYALSGQDVFVLGMKNSEEAMFLPAAPLVGTPSHEEIVAIVRRIYEDKFKFRVFPEDMMPKLSIELHDDKRIKYLIPLVDARIPSEYWQSMQDLGMNYVLLNSFTTGDPSILSMVMVEPGVQALFLRRLNERLPRKKNLSSLYLAECLRERWSEHLQLVTSSEGRIQQAATASGNGQT